MIELGPNSYGKSAVRLVKLVRGPEHHLKGQAGRATGSRA